MSNESLPRRLFPPITRRPKSVKKFCMRHDVTALEIQPGE